VDEVTVGDSGKSPSGPRNWWKTARGRMLSLAAATVGLEVRHQASGYSFRGGPLYAIPARLLAVVALLGSSILFLSTVVTFPFYSPVSNVEELTLFYTSAGNLVKYGFLNSGFLPDYSTSSRALDHPYVYSHMPPGPDIFIALLLKLVPEGYRLVRLVFWAVFLAGMVCYFRFAELILKQFKVSGAGYALLLTTPFMILHTFDDPVYAAFPLLAFLPLLTLQAYYRTQRTWYLAGTLGVGLFSAVYLDYLTLLVVSWCWGLLYFTQLLRLELRHLIAFAGVIVGGLVVHLVQNYLYLGGDLFFHELWVTITNRTTGVPTQDELKAFYREHGLVHHGAGRINPLGVLYQLLTAIYFPGLILLAVAALIAVLWGVQRNLRMDTSRQSWVIERSVEMCAFATAAKRFALLWVWVIGAITLPMMMLPAFTQEYGIRGTGLHSYFLGIAAVASVLYGIKTAALQIPPTFGTAPLGSLTWRDLRVCVLAAVVLALLVGVVVQLGKARLGEIRPTLRDFSRPKFYKLDEIHQQFGGEVFMTNVNPVPVGFFAREAGYGVCELDSLPEAGDIAPSQCRVSYMRDRAYYDNVRPRYFFFFRGMFPGFSQCLPPGFFPMLDRGDDCFETMQKRLERRFHRAADTGLFEVYDLMQRK
jgi:hypothetical protein